MSATMPTFVITRRFKAKKQLVFDCFTKPEHLSKWFAAPGTTTELVSADIRPGGYSHIRFFGSEGLVFYGKYTYIKIEPHDLLEYLNAFADENANETRHPMAPDWPLELYTTVTFLQVGDETEIHLTWVPHNSTETEIAAFEGGLESCHQGWGRTLDGLDNYLLFAAKGPSRLDLQIVSDRAFRIRRSFDAPAQLVFDAFTQCDKLKKWLDGPEGWSLATCVMSTTVGDSYRWGWANVDGTTMGISGKILACEPPNMIEISETFDDPWYPGEGRSRIEFNEIGGKTILTQTVTYESPEALRIALSSPMEEGMVEGYDKLADLVSLN